jgi:hypothetical protein
MLFYHVYIYLCYDKNISINNVILTKFVIRMIVFVVFNELFKIFFKNVKDIDAKEFHKLSSLDPFVKLFKNSPYFLAHYIINVYLLYDFYIDGYYRWFAMFKHGLIFIHTAKAICNYYPLKFLDQILEIFKNINICSMALICLSDPLINTDIRPTRICFFETYCRFLETEILMMAYYIISRDLFATTEEEEMNMASLIAVIGEYDCFRYTAFLLIFHYFFILINTLAFSFKYAYSFFTLFIVYFILTNYKSKQKNFNLMLQMMSLVVINLAIYTYAFLKSAPNIGDGFTGQVVGVDDTSIKIGQYILNRLINCPIN